MCLCILASAALLEYVVWCETVHTGDARLDTRRVLLLRQCSCARRLAVVALPGPGKLWQQSFMLPVIVKLKGKGVLKTQSFRQPFLTENVVLPFFCVCV